MRTDVHHLCVKKIDEETLNRLVTLLDENESDEYTCREPRHTEAQDKIKHWPKPFMLDETLDEVVRSSSEVCIGGTTVDNAVLTAYNLYLIVVKSANNKRTVNSALKKPHDFIVEEYGIKPVVLSVSYLKGGKLEKGEVLYEM